MRLLVFVLLFSGSYLNAQDCLDFSIEEYLYEESVPDSFRIRITVSRVDSQAGNWINSELDTGTFGEPVVVGPFSCTVNLIGFTDLNDPSCGGFFSPSYPDLCGNGDCPEFVVQQPESLVSCRTTGPIITIEGGRPPLELTTDGPNGTQTQMIDFRDRTIDFSTAAIGEYQIRITSGENCSITENFTISEACDATISGNSWLDQNADGIRQDGEPAQTASAILSLEGINLDTTSISADGTYTFTGLGPGLHRIVFESTNSNQVLTALRAGDDPTRDNDVRNGTQQTIVSLATSQQLSGESDAGWVGTGCSASFELTPTSCNFDNGAIRIASIEGGTLRGIRLSRELPLRDELVDLSPGTYEVTAVFADGCTHTEQVDIEGQEINISFQAEGTFCANPTTYSLTASSDHTSAITSFAWSNGVASSTTTNVFPEEEISVTITHADGCQVQNNFTPLRSTAAIPFPNDLQSDCETGELTLTLPEPFRGMDVNWDSQFGGIGTGDTFQIIGGGGFSVGTLASTGCDASWIGFIKNSSLTNWTLSSSDDASCSPSSEFWLAPEDNLANGFRDIQNYTMRYTGPNGFDSGILQGFAGSFINVPDPGTYTLVLSSFCGDTTLTAEVGLTTADSDCRRVSGITRINPAGFPPFCNIVATNRAPLPAALMKFSPTDGEEDLFTFADAQGVWDIVLPLGQYTVSAVINEDSLYQNCIESDLSYQINMIGLPIEDYEYNVYTPLECAQLSVDIAIPRFRRCFENIAAITYANFGDVTATGAILILEVDSFLINFNSTPPFTQQGRFLTFELGDLPPYSSGRIDLNFEVSCAAELGQAHCLYADIEAPEKCQLTPNTAYVSVEPGGCTSDSLSFLVSNFGPVPMTIPLAYTIYEDGERNFSLSGLQTGLAAGETVRLSFPASGSTIQLVVQQEPNAAAPDFPSATIAGCNGLSPGFLNLLPTDPGLPDRVTLCRENIGSYDPNEKLAFPTGLGATGDIQPGTRLTYELHFQNTGTDTAFTVVIRDTLPPELDITSLKPGAATHPYTVDFDSARVLTFTFNNIMLVDSSTNNPESQGVVSFSIDHLEGLTRGTTFRNRVGIFFDFNEPVITNYISHRIAPEELLITSTDQPNIVSQNIKISPNPATNELKVRFTAASPTSQQHLTILNILGHPVMERSVNTAEATINISALTAGTYFLLVETNGGRIQKSKFVVVR